MTTAVARTTVNVPSTDRTPALAATVRPKTAAARIGAATRRLLSALMRSLAVPHV
jgi:hypothetical protein